MALYDAKSLLQKIDTHPQYHSSGLSDSDLISDPIALFSQWFAAAQASKVVEPETVCVSTSTPEGRVSSRYVLLKRVDARGFVFFTNYESRKGKEINSNPRAALAFHWRELHQQIRITGKTEKVTKEETAEYFQGRPVGSRIGAWASPQSQPVKDRAELQRLVEKMEDRFGVERGSTERTEPSNSDLEATVETPDHWGGVRVVPDEIEFWVGRPNRLHDRYLYERKEENGKWEVQRLAP